MATEDKVPVSSKEKKEVPGRTSTSKRVNSLARFFKAWATPIGTVIAVGTLLWGVALFTLQQQATQQQALDQQRQATLDTYLDRMSDLLLSDQLSTSHPGDAVQVLATARTYAAIRNLDGARKGTLVRFLLEAKLINGAQPIISLPGADLSGAIFIVADLSGVNLSGADLSEAIFTGANLSGAIFIDANLTGADLRSADLLGTNLSGANLTGANLSGVYKSSVAHPFMGQLVTGFGFGNQLDQVAPPPPEPGGANLNGANLSGADLSGADLSGANLHGAQVTTEQLAQAKSLKGAIMPDGSKHP